MSQLFTFTVKARIEAGTLQEDGRNKYTLQGAFVGVDEDGNETPIGDMAIPVGGALFSELAIGDYLRFPLVSEDEYETLIATRADDAKVVLAIHPEGE